MHRLLKIVDQSLGYVPPSNHSHDPNLSPSEAHAAHHASQSQQSHSTTKPSDLSNLYHTSTVQEKWLDHSDIYAQFEREGWKLEGERAVNEANEKSLEEAGGEIGRGGRMREREHEGMEVDDDDDDDIL